MVGLIAKSYVKQDNLSIQSTALSNTVIHFRNKGEYLLVLSNTYLTLCSIIGVYTGKCRHLEIANYGLSFNYACYL